MNFAEKIIDTAALVEKRLTDYLTGARGPVAPPERLAEAMRYAALGGGKRLRPVLLIESAALFSVRCRRQEFIPRLAVAQQQLATEAPAPCPLWTPA